MCGRYLLCGVGWLSKCINRSSSSSNRPEAQGYVENAVEAKFLSSLNTAHILVVCREAQETSEDFPYHSLEKDVVLDIGNRIQELHLRL